MGKMRRWGLEAAGAANLGLRQHKGIRNDTGAHVTSKVLGPKRPVSTGLPEERIRSLVYEVDLAGVAKHFLE